MQWGSRLPADPRTWIQAERDEVDHAVLRDAAGDELPLPPAGERRVAIEGTIIEQERLTVRGWAADTDTKEPAAEILIYVGDALVHHEPPNEESADLVRRFNSGRLSRAGFDITIATSEIPEGTERLTVAARFHDGAVLVYVTIPRE